MTDCWVYESLERVEIFTQPSTNVLYETGKFFVPGDLVCVDFLKQPANTKRPGSSTGRYLRLNDGSGWVCLSPGSNPSQNNFQPVPVEVGLWCFFVDNFPDGMRLCNHPMDELQWQWQNLTLHQEPNITLPPMHKVYCDRRVKGRDGAHFYRLQHAQRQTATWVLDKRKRRSDSSANSPQHGQQHNMMVPESQIQQGVFAFRALKSLKLRMYPLANKRNLTGISVAPNDVIVCDIIRGEKYYRMIDGSGWVFATINQDLRQVGCDAGTWAFRVTSSYGVSLQTQPDDDRSTFGDVIPHNAIVVCDGKLSQGFGPHKQRCFYHVQATNGWVSDMARDRRVMERVSADAAAKPATSEEGWTEGFVRGVSLASMADAREISHHPESNLISYSHPAGPNLQVFYTTRTVGISEHGGQPVFCRNLGNAELVEIFKDPIVYLKKVSTDESRMVDKEDDPTKQEDPVALKRQEINVRNQLLTLDQEFAQLQAKKDGVWKKVGVHQEARDEKEFKVQELWQEHMKQRLEEEEHLKKQEETKAGSANKVSSSENCYVYRVLDDIGVRSAPNVDSKYRTEQSFFKGHLVSIDSILDFVSQNRCGPYLRLSDGSGWLFKRDAQGQVMEEVDVEVGLWNFYVGNEPSGIGLRNHPIDQLDNGQNGFIFPEETTLNYLKPFQRVSCDRKVVGQDGVNFYRVQGSPRTAWILDKRSNAGTTEVLLHPANQVRVGMFAFEALDEIAIRSQASVAKKYQTKQGVSPGDMVVADLIFEADYDNRNGPYLRLADGSGWLFVNIDGDKVMKDIPIKTGKWKFRITHPNGQKLLKHPVDKLVAKTGSSDADFKENQVVICDREIKGSNGMCWFYRPVGRDGWLPNIHGKMGFMTEEIIDEAEEEATAWSVDLVRGVALAVDGMKEIEHDERDHVLTFQSSQGATVKVYYTTLSVETSQGGPALGRVQLRSGCTREDLVEILKDPVEDACRRPSKRRRRECEVAPPNETSREDDYRNRLLELDKEEEQIKEQREALWKVIKEHEKTKEETPGEAPFAPVASISTEKLVCPTCDKVFGSLYAKQMHQEKLGH